MESTTFGRKKALKIVGKEMISSIEKKFQYLTKQKLWEKTYGVKPVDLELKNHMVSFSTQGHRGLIYFTVFKDKTLILFIYKKKMELIHLRMRFHPSLFKTTILEGEFHRDNSGRYLFGISDIWFSCGENLMNMSLTKRMTYLKDIMTKKYHPDDYLDPFYFYLKPYFELKEKEKVINEIMPRLNFPTIGIAYRPYNNLKSIEHIEILNKISEISNNVILSVKKGLNPDEYFVSCYRGTSLYQIGKACIPDLSSSFMMRKIFKNEDSKLMECVWSKEFKKWTPRKEMASNSPITHFDKLKV